MPTPTPIVVSRRLFWRTLTLALAILFAPSHPVHAAFPGVPGLIGFSDFYTLNTIKPDGTGLAQIQTNTPYAAYFSWSPDGHRVLFATRPFVDAPADEIYVIDADGTNLTRLTFFDGTDEEPSWSPDGTKIVWQRHCDIWVMNADGSDQHNLTPPESDCTFATDQDFHPKWSPDGTRISFESHRDGPINIFTMNPDGTGVVNVSGVTSRNSDADWSPDGTKIVFRSDRDHPPSRFEIYVMDADGQHQTRLTTPPAMPPDPYYRLSPVWSPDGTRIAFVQWYGSVVGIYTMNADGSNVRLVTRAKPLYPIDWQPAPGPDLIQSALGNPPAYVSPNGAFSVGDTVSNQGALAAGSSRTNYYLSQDDKKSSEDALLGGRQVSGIAAGASAAGSAIVKVPPSTALGTYRLIACADIQKTVGETNEANNCRTADGSITISLPDLQQNSVSNPPVSAAAGGKFMVSDTVQNVSLVTIAQSGTRYYLSDNTIKSPGDVLLTGKRAVPTLTAGQSNTGGAGLIVPLGTAAGPYYLLACADDLGGLNESDEANNCIASATTITITP